MPLVKRLLKFISEIENVETLNQKEHESSLILANAGELAAAVIKRVAGNDISNAINNSPLTREMIQNLTFRKIAEKVSSTSV